MAYSIFFIPVLFAAFGFLALAVPVLYRLTLHPLARFPGPFWAKISTIYGMTFDLNSESQGYVKDLPRLHEKYGPIIRIHPNELHIRDIDAYYQVFRPGTPFDKERTFYNKSFTDGFFNVPKSRDVKPWKDVYQPYFSKAAIGRLEPSIHAQLRTFLSRLRNASSQGKVVDMTYGLRSFTGDIVMGYCFADKGFRTIEEADFRSPTLVALEQFFAFVNVAIYFPGPLTWVEITIERLPKSIQKRLLAPAMAATKWIQEQCEEKLSKLLKDGGSQSGNPTVFDSWADPAQAKQSWRPTLKQLTADAFTFHGAGTDTTAHTLTIGCWYIMTNPAIRAKLREELRQAIPDVNCTEIVSASKLENLSYLRAVVKESLRLSYGPPSRVPRTVPKEGAVMCGQQIPAGTTVNISTYCIHNWERYFKDAQTFRPERWLEPDAGELDRYMVSFSRGSRSCLGMNLAMAELYLVLAYLFRIFDLTPYNTTSADIEEWKDCFIPCIKKHLEVKLEVLE